MNIGINQITKEEFNSNVKIKFENILEGFDKYKSKTLNADNKYSFKENEKAFIKLIEDMYKLNISENGKSNCYIDFYLKDLSDDEYENLLTGLNFEYKDQLNYIRCHNKINTEYFEVNDISIIKILTIMCTRELFFITFYFTKLELTIWGNYNLSFPIFYDNERTLNEYINIVRKYELNIN